MTKTKQSDDANTRVALHRTKMTANGSRRVEVTVPNRDAALVKSIAASLRSGGELAQQVRETLEPLVSTPKAKTGSGLLEFLRTCPPLDEDLDIERDRSAGRSVDF